jgi:uncharacterized protein YkwD
MPLPPRKLIAEEITEWIRIYNELGSADEFELEVARLTNIEREAHGLRPLTINNSLMMSARFKAQSLVEFNYVSHSSPIYGSFSNIGREVFGQRVQGENLAGGVSPESVVMSWMDSPPHRRNILNSNWTEIGVGFVPDKMVGAGEGFGMWIQHFN